MASLKPCTKAPTTLTVSVQQPEDSRLRLKTPLIDLTFTGYNTTATSSWRDGSNQKAFNVPVGIHTYTIAVHTYSRRLSSQDFGVKNPYLHEPTFPSHIRVSISKSGVNAKGINVRYDIMDSDEFAGQTRRERREERTTSLAQRLFNSFSTLADLTWGVVSQGIFSKR